MKYDDFTLPKLIDSQTGQYLYETLRQCHEHRIYTYSWAFNAIIVVIFVTIGIITLYLCYTRKRTPKEEEAKLLMEQKIILDKIRGLKENKQDYYREGSYTQLPFVDSNISL